MCKDNWNPLPDMDSIVKAQAWDWEIERFFNEDWRNWDNNDWKSCWFFRGRPKQPKKITVTCECWRNKHGVLTYRNPGQSELSTNEWKRFPAGDITGEVEE